MSNPWIIWVWAYFAYYFLFSFLCSKFMFTWAGRNYLMLWDLCLWDFYAFKTFLELHAVLPSSSWCSLCLRRINCQLEDLQLRIYVLKFSCSLFQSTFHKICRLVSSKPSIPHITFNLLECGNRYCTYFS